MGEHSGHTLEPADGALVAAHHPHDEGVEGHQDDGPEQAARHRVVVADDGVLHHVAEEQQHDEVERVELGQVAFSAQPQQEEDAAVDGGGADGLLQHGHAEVEEVVADHGGRHGWSSFSGARRAS